MARIVRVAAFVLIVAAVGSTPVHGTTIPTFGARLQPVPLIYEQQPWVRVENLDALPVSVELASDDPAWTLAEYGPFVLEPGKARKVPVTGAGEQEAVITARIRAITDAAAGPDTVALVLQTTARHPNLLEEIADSGGPWLLAAVLALIVAFLATHRRRHDYYVALR